MILLCLIAKKETYGYEIISELNETGRKTYCSDKCRERGNV